MTLSHVDWQISKLPKWCGEPVTRTIRAIGDLTYNEGTQKTLAAYVDGRIDRLYADYNGVVVNEGDRLALIYSPKLYSGQVELLLAKKATDGVGLTTLQRAADSNRALYASSRERLKELGMTANQIDRLEQSGKASSRLHLVAPISGTVIEKFAVEGEYVKEGKPIYRLADLSTVWLMLQLFPDDASQIRYGQRVEAIVQSFPEETFEGRVAFVSPNVDPKTRTVGVRVVVPNPEGRLKIGDFAKSEVEVQITASGKPAKQIYDSDLANQWISPRHPHVIRSEPGNCPICNIELVPASKYGFTDSPRTESTPLVVPRDAVLMAGSHSVVYVETKPGQFELRRIVLGPILNNRVVVLDGVSEGEQVATNGNFLIDSQMQLTGNPSLIDPTKAKPPWKNSELSPEALEALSSLSPEDEERALEQRICPVSDQPLGSMGTPMKVDVHGKPVFICCEGCRERLLENPDKYLAKLEESKKAGNSPEQEKIEKALEELPPEDRELARRQEICPVSDEPLGSMGTPIKVDVNGKRVFICCEGCRGPLLDNPDKYLKKLEEKDSAEGESGGQEGEEMSFELPPVGMPEMVEPSEGTGVEQRSSGGQPGKNRGDARERIPSRPLRYPRRSGNDSASA